MDMGGRMRNLRSPMVSAGIATWLALAGCGGSGGGAGTGGTPPAAQGVEVRVTPASAALAAGDALAFSAQVTGTSVTTVTWSVREPGGGTVDASGLYLAPASAGTYHVVATSTAAPASSAAAEVA